MKKIICAFPTLGKTYAGSHYKKVADVDFGVLRSWSGGDNYSNGMSSTDSLRCAEDLFNLISDKLTRRGSIVLTNEPKLKFPWDAEVTILLPSYDAAEAVKRCKQRGSSDELVQLIDKNYSVWVKDWKRIAESEGYNLAFCSTVEDYLRDNDLISD